MYYAWITITVLFSAFVLIRHGKDLVSLVRAWRHSANAKKHRTQAQAARDFVLFAQDYNRFAPGLELQVDELRDPFLKHSLKTFLSGAVRGPELLRSLRQAADEYHEQENKEIDELRGIQRFLPAVGWMTTMIGLAWFFQAPSFGEHYMAQAGSVFTAVAGTVLYGLGMIYAVIDPILKKLTHSAYWNRRRNLMIIEGVSLLMKHKTAFEIYEHLNMTLKSEERFELEHILPDLESQAS